MKNRILKNIFILFLFLTVVSCNYQSFHDQGMPQGAGNNGNNGVGTCTPGATPANTIDFQKVTQEVFQPKCFACHSGGSGAAGLNIDNYSSAKSFAAQIDFAVKSNSMPKAPVPPLGAQEKSIVAQWVQNGAPETITVADCDPNNPTPTDPIDPVDPTDPTQPITKMPADDEINFTLVSDRIFKFHCTSCHSTASGNAGGLNLETYFNTLDEIEDIEERVFEQTMPPKFKPSLSEVERNVVLRWIALGAPR